MLLRTVIGVLGLGFLYVGFVGLFRPEQLAQALELAPVSAAGIGSVRAMVGAHYFAMGAVALAATLSKNWSWLVPLAAIEGVMVLARLLAATSGELGQTGMPAAAMETIACIALGLGAYLPARESAHGKGN